MKNHVLLFVTQPVGTKTQKHKQINPKNHPLGSSQPYGDVLVHWVRGHATHLGSDDSDDSECVRVLLMLMRGKETETHPPDMPGFSWTQEAMEPEQNQKADARLLVQQGGDGHGERHLTPNWSAERAGRDHLPNTQHPAKRSQGSCQLEDPNPASSSQQEPATHRRDYMASVAHLGPPLRVEIVFEETRNPPTDSGLSLSRQNTCHAARFDRAHISTEFCECLGVDTGSGCRDITDIQDVCTMNPRPRSWVRRLSDTSPSVAVARVFARTVPMPRQEEKEPHPVRNSERTLRPEIRQETHLDELSPVVAA